MINKACCSLLFLTCIALSIPTAAHSLYGTEQMTDAAVKNMSHGTAIVLVLVYVISAVHPWLFQHITKLKCLSEESECSSWM